MGWIILGILVGVTGISLLPFIIGEIEDKKALNKWKKEEEEQKRREQEKKDNLQARYDKVWNAQWEQNGKPVDIRNIPQLSFSQWLTFYNSAPERWNINLLQFQMSYYHHYCVMPEYIKGKTHIDIFWETPEDLEAFLNWQTAEYKKGNAAIFENERNKQLAKLTKCLREDINERTKQTQKELEELERQVKENMPVSEDPIQKCLREEREEKDKKYPSLLSFIEHLSKKYPDFICRDNSVMMTHDGREFVEITFINKHKPENILRITGEYDKKAGTWVE